MNNDDSTNGPKTFFTADHLYPLRGGHRRSRYVGSRKVRLRDGWQLSPLNPYKFLADFPALSLKPGWQLAAYQHYGDGNGHGEVIAVPEDVEIVEPVDIGQNKLQLPEGAAENLMSAISADGSPWSYLCASIFAREADAFGGLWHGINWEMWQIVDAPVLDEDANGFPAREVERLEEWYWSEPMPTDWRPFVDLGGAAPRVQFYAATHLGGQRVCRFQDMFGRDDLCFFYGGTNPGRRPWGI